MSRLFGTDGVRGKAGDYPLDSETVRRLGSALVRALEPDRSRRLSLLIGRDPRESGAELERELAYGAGRAGAAVTSAGVMPTPAIAYLTSKFGFDAGLVISASHNPYDDNGIKVFSGRGEKFTETLERQTEAIVADASWSVPPGAAAAVPYRDLRDAYLDHVRRVLPDGAARGLRVTIDCANGAMSAVAPALFRSLGVDLEIMNSVPDGRNINRECGSIHPEALARAVASYGRQIGSAFDGDGDRAILIDERGRIVNGDAVLLMCAKHLHTQGRLPGEAVVATVMSNIGLELALRELGIGLVRCPVGDKYVMEEMLRRGIALGGEQSGHIIFSAYLYTGDGLITALNVLRTMRETGRTLASLADDLRTYPQVLVSVRVRSRVELSTHPEIEAAIADIDQRLRGTGRVLVRYSGTEPLLRVMVEGEDEAQIRQYAERIASEVRKHIGA